MIGIFDSGVGGLSVLYAIRERLPSVDVVYFGDIKHAPYGSRSREELSDLTVRALSFLIERGATKIVSACNSVSASLAVSLVDASMVSGKDLIEMVGPTVGTFRGSDARILLVATPATIHSGIYQSAFRMIGKDVQCREISELAGAIEAGDSEERIRTIITHTLSSVSEPFDTLVLACTHYPLVTHLFRDMAGNAVQIFDPALAVALRVEKQWWPQESGAGTTTFVISKESETFRSMVTRLFPNTQYAIEIV